MVESISDTKLLAAVADATHRSMTRAGFEAALYDALVTAGPAEAMQLLWTAAPPDTSNAWAVADGDQGQGALILEGAPPMSSAVRRQLLQLVGLGQRTVRRFERVASVSRQAHQRIVASQTPTNGIVSRSPAMQAAVARLDAVAPHPTTVLIRGASGVGKERFARALHQRSGRPGAFVAVNSGALPESLIESELFGHEAGAYTSAVASRKGRFELAHRGTLFLDEVAELPASTQVRLLRILEDGAVTRVGAEQPRRIDVRVVCATHRSLETMVERGLFREDLFFRLTPFEIELPSLDRRTEDVPELLAQLVTQHARRLGRAPPVIDATTVADVASRAWPGNVRELSNAVEQGLILSAGAVFQLPRPTRSRRKTRTAGTFDEACRQFIKDALATTQGRIHGPQGAAARLALKPTTLQGKMRRLGISKDDR